jgi:hypothetical protein
MPKCALMFEDLGFPSAHYVDGRASVADLFRMGERCGLYILQFSNDEFYAGQAVDVVRRYTQHCKVHRDIVAISFRCLERAKLNNAERDLIWTLERAGYPLRNITLTSIPHTDSDFDLIMAPAEQHRWLDDDNVVDDSGSRPNDPELRRKYTRRFTKLQASPQYSMVINILRLYARRGLPAMRRGELSFWAVSCLPSPQVLARININWQEVCTLFLDSGTLYLSLHVAESVFIKMSWLSAWQSQLRHRNIVVDGHRYAPGGQDQRRLELPAINAQKLLEDDHFWPALRLFNLRLMQKGSCTFGRYHCFDLADQMLSPA